MPAIDVYITSYMSSLAIRGKHERTLRHLSSARLEFTTHDVRRRFPYDVARTRTAQVGAGRRQESDT